MTRTILRASGIALLTTVISSGCVFDKSGIDFFYIQTAEPPGACRGAPYSYLFGVNGGKPPYSWSATPPGSVPPGLKLDSSSGLLHGTPTQDGAYKFTLEVKDSGSKNALEQFDLTVGEFNITTPNHSALFFCSGAASEVGLATCGGTPTVTWKQAGAPWPPGLQLTSDGRLTISPSATGAKYTVRVRAQDGSNPPKTAEKNFKLESSGHLVITSASTLPAAHTAVPYGPVDLRACGGSGSYTWTNPDKALAGNGLTLSTQNNAGRVQGTPKTAGALVFDAQVTDTNPPPGQSHSYSKDFQLPVYPGALAFVSTSPLPDAAECAPYTYTFQAQGGSGKYTYSLQGQGPPGLQLDSIGKLYGPPPWPAVNPVSFNVRLADGTSTPIVQPFSLKVLATPATPPLIVTELRHAGSGPSGYDKISLGSSKLVKFDYRFSAAGPPLSSPMQQARLQLLGTCGYLGSTDFAGPGDVNSDGQKEMVARFPAATVVALLKGAGKKAGQHATLRLSVDVSVDGAIKTFVRTTRVSLVP